MKYPIFVSEYNALKPKMKQLSFIPLMVVCTIVLGVQLAGCRQNNTNIKDQFEWEAGWNAPELYPAEVISGRFENADGDGESLIQDSNGGGWGEMSTYSAGGKKTLPDTLRVHWYSFTEDKFYRGVFGLDKALITKLFREGFNRFRGKDHVTYSYIIAGFAPGGVVSVWIAGEGKQVEVGVFKAQEAEYMTADEFLPGHRLLSSTPKEQWNDIIQRYRTLSLEDFGATDNLASHGTPFGLWDSTYRERFNSRIALVYEDKEGDCITDEILIEYVNGEKESLSLDELVENPFKMRPRIRFVNYYFSRLDNQGSRKYSQSKIEFNEKDLWQAYDSVSKGDHERPIELQIHRTKNNLKHSGMMMTSCEKQNNDSVHLNMDIHLIYNYTVSEDWSMGEFEVYKQLNKK